MKKFRFSLETVKIYKEQLLENLKTEYSVSLAQMREKEAEIEELQEKKQQTQQAWTLKVKEGLSIRDNQQYQHYIDRLYRQIKVEQQKLQELIRIVEEKRLKVVEMQKETMTLDKLREKKQEEYDHISAKANELFIEEFVVRSILK